MHPDSVGRNYREVAWVWCQRHNTRQVLFRLLRCTVTVWPEVFSLYRRDVRVQELSLHMHTLNLGIGPLGRGVDDRVIFV